jgi:hypothetical protein
MRKVKMIRFPLEAELVPTGTWGANLRALLPPSGWNRLRSHYYEKADHKCEICGETGFTQNRNHAVEAHESWEYDDVSHTQTLTGIQALCPRCHMVKHYGRSMSVGGLNVVREHIAKVNGWDASDMILLYEQLIFDLHSMRSRFRWDVSVEKQLREWLDAGILKQRDVDKALENLKKAKYDGED